MEEYCLALLMRYPDLGGYSVSLAPEFFLRPENREIFTNYLDADLDEGEALAGGEGRWTDTPPGVRERVEALRDRKIPAMDITKRRKAISDVVARLEERNLRQQKQEEYDRFADASAELGEEDHRNAVEINERLRLNQTLRSGPRIAR